MADNNEQGLLAAEEARRLAMLAADIKTLDGMLGVQLAYVHSSGGTDSKQSYLQKLGDGDVRYDTLEFVSPSARIIGTVGLVSGVMRAAVSSRNGSKRQVFSNYLAVWEHGASGWSLQALQSTALPPEAA